MSYFLHSYGVDLAKLTVQKRMESLLLTQDARSDRIQVEVFNGGAVYDLSGGTGTAYIMRGDGNTVVVADLPISGNVMYCDLPAEAYNVPGVVTITLKHTEDGEINSLIQVTATVRKSSSGNAIDPGGEVVLRFEEAIAELEEVEASIPPDYSTLAAGVVRHDTAQSLTDVQKNTARGNIGAAGADELDVLCSAPHTLPLTWEQGSISYTGGNFPSNTRVRTPAFYSSRGGCVAVVSAPSGYEVAFRLYSQTNVGSFVGRYPEDDSWVSDGFRFAIPAGRYVRFVARKASDEGINPSEVADISVTLMATVARNFAPVDTPTASNTYNPGDLLTVSGTFYEATQAIAPGTVITPGTNVTETTVAAQLAERDTAIAEVKADAEDIFMEPWQLVAKKYFLPDSSGNLTVRRNHITYTPSASQSSPAVRSLIGSYEGANTTLGGYTPTIDQLIPVSVFGDAIKIGFYLDAAGTTRYPRFAYKFCTVDGETVTPISDAYGTVPTTAAANVLAETSVTIPDDATHVFFGLLYSNGYTANATYDMVYKVDKG